MTPDDLMGPLLQQIAALTVERAQLLARVRELEASVQPAPLNETEPMS